MTRRYGIAMVALLSGCSAIIEPDPTRLGGDAGRSDAGRSDAGRADAGRTDGGTCPASCDDGVPCTIDACEAGACVHTRDDSACPGERCNPVLGCVPQRCTSNAECDDGVFCNGPEACVDGAPDDGCVAGAPIACPDDGATCTSERCDEASDACVADRDLTMCDDGIPCTIDSCDPPRSTSPSGCARTADNAVCATDFCTIGRTCDLTLGCTGGVPRACDDANACTVDMCSSATGSCVTTPVDVDMDTFPPVSCGGTDCDDTQVAVNPSATEACNGRDDDCDGTIDEGCTVDVPADECRTAGTISLTATTTATVTGTFSTFRDHYQTNPYCGAQTGGRDAVYAVVLPTGLYDVTIDTIGSAAGTVLAVGLECSAAGFGAVCHDDIDPTTRASRIWVHRVGSRFGQSTLYVLVDAFNSTQTGGFVLNVRRGAAAPDDCPSGTGGALPLELIGGGAVLGFQTEFVSGESGTCSPSFDTQPEAIFRVRGPMSANVHFEIFSADFNPIAYFRLRPCGSGTELGCQVGAALGGGINGAVIDETVIAGELYYLFVDGGRTAYAVYYEPF